MPLIILPTVFSLFLAKQCWLVVNDPYYDVENDDEPCTMGWLILLLIMLNTVLIMILGFCYLASTI